MPPYSFGRWGAHSPAWLTLTLISSRSSMLWRRLCSRSSSVSPPSRRDRHSVSSLGRISALMKSAVRRRMSLISGSRAGIGVTLIATVVSFSGVRVVDTHHGPAGMLAAHRAVPGASALLGPAAPSSTGRRRSCRHGLGRFVDLRGADATAGRRLAEEHHSNRRFGGGPLSHRRL